MIKIIVEVPETFKVIDIRISNSDMVFAMLFSIPNIIVLDKLKMEYNTT